MATRILVIEDDADVRTSLRLLLEDEQYDVIEASDGETGLALFSNEMIDLTIIDLKLPDRSGFDVCRAIRSSSEVPIVIVTAQVDAYDVVAGLEAGADDYVTNPFVPKVLTARLRALLRRTQSLGADGQRTRFGDVEIAPKEGVVTKAGEPVHLTKTEFLLLCDLAEHPNQVMSRDVLLERVWGYEYVGDSRLVDSHIRRLRVKVETDPDHPTLIQTVRGLGYKLNPP
ncbi:MAG: DNA-binding response regulator [Actinobacteria bacterium]|nr:MAG: DNA-binding response regulator [Actinomycetota bacterium]